MVIYGVIRELPIASVKVLVSGEVLFPISLIAFLVSGGVVFTMVHRSFPGMLREGALSPVGWNPTSLKPTLIAALGGTLLAVIYLYVAIKILPIASTQKVGAMATAAAASHGWPKMIWVVLLLVGAPIEEFLFRGGMLAGFTRSLGAGRSAAIVTALFVLMHMSETHLYYPAIISIAVVALCTLVARYWSDSLIPPICFHASYNLVIAIYGVLYSV